MINIVLDKTTGARTACICVSEKVEGKESETTFKYCLKNELGYFIRYKNSRQNTRSLIEINSFLH